MLGNDSLVDPVCIHDAFQNFSSRPRTVRITYRTVRHHSETKLLQNTEEQVQLQNV